MELYATGFNAWNQLEFEPSEMEENPLDIFTFKKILQGVQMEPPVAALSYTLARVDNHILHAGMGLQDSHSLELRFNSVETANGQVYTTKGKPPQAPAEAHMGSEHGIWKLPSLSHTASPEDYKFWPSEVPVRQIAAFDVGLVILYEDGTVATMGDPRFEACLGREVCDDNPADKPCRVVDLDDLEDPVRQVAAGGYTAAAVTEGGSLYVWGTRTAGTHRKEQAFDALGGIPNYVEVDGGKDVQQVALGESHAMVLTTDGCLYIRGDHSNGQLGLGSNFEARAKDWVKLELTVPCGHEIVGIGAGPRSSFVMTAVVSPKDKA